MNEHTSPLDDLRVASPCNASWDKMVGDDRQRFCLECNKNVYNISGMPRAEAEAFVAGATGRVCIRMYQRRDGTVLTEDCPVGARRPRRRLMRAAKVMAAAALAFVSGAVGLDGAQVDSCDAMLNVKKTGRGEYEKMGKMAMPAREDTTSRHQVQTQRVDTVRLDDEMLVMGEVAFVPEKDSTAPELFRVITPVDLTPLQPVSIVTVVDGGTRFVIEIPQAVLVDTVEPEVVTPVTTPDGPDIR